jgi:hypothetical protein
MTTDPQTRSDPRGLTKLSLALSSSEISSLAGLEWLKGLTALSLNLSIPKSTGDQIVI